MGTNKEKSTHKQDFNVSKNLSNLQKQILLLAYINGGTVFEHRGKRLSTSNVDLSTEDVLKEVFKSKSSTARASVSRSFRRLKERGLAKRFHQLTRSGQVIYSGIKLTCLGRERAKNLLVNTISQGGSG